MSKKKSPVPSSVTQHTKPNLPVFILSSILLTILVVSFVFAPAFVPAQSINRGIVFGRYGSQEIAYRQGNIFARDLEQAMQEASSQGYDMDSSFIYYTMWLRAFRTASQYAVLMDHAQRSGIDISEDQLTDGIKESGFFSRNGVFNSADFNNMPPDRRQSIINDIRHSLLISSYQEKLTQNIIRSDEAISVLAHPSKKQRNFRMAIFNFKDYPAEKIHAFAEENPQLFQQISVKRILIQGKKQDAVRIYSRLVNKEAEFSSIFFENSREEFANEDISAQEGDLGQRFFYQISDSLQNPTDAMKIFSLEEQGISEPVRYKTQDAKAEVYAIYLVTKAKTNLNLKSSKQRQTVLDYLIANRKGLISDYFISQVNLIKAANFNASVDAPGKVIQTDYFHMVYRLNPETLSRQEAMYYPYNGDIRSFLDSFGSDNQDIASAALPSREFFFQAFSLQPGQISQPIILDNAVLALQMINERPVEELPNINSTLDFLLSYFLGQNTMSSMIDQSLKSRRYKDNFNKVYAKKIEPLVQQQQATSQMPQTNTPLEGFGPQDPSLQTPPNPGIGIAP